MFGTKGSNAVEWVIGGDGKTGMSVPTGCIALVSSSRVVSWVAFSNNNSYAYANSNLRNKVENAVTFTTDEQAVIQERTLSNPDIAGDSVTAAVWAPTLFNAFGLSNVGLSSIGNSYWLCSPGEYDRSEDEYHAAFVYTDGRISSDGEAVNDDENVRVGLYIDLSKIYGATAVEGEENTYTLNLTAPEEDTFLTSFTLNKDYNDKYITDAKTTKVNETVTFTITPITENAPEFDDDTFSISVTEGVGSTDVGLPGTDDIDSVGDYWYKIEETAGTTAGVDYDDTTYYLHLIVSYKNGEFGFSSAAIRSSNDVTATDGVYPETGKIDTVTNTYGEGSLTVGQVTTVNGEDSSEDTFTAEVTFTAPTGTTVTGEIKYGDLTIDPEDWDNGSVTVEIELKGGDTVLFENIPDGVTYTVEQTESNEDMGYQLDDVAFDNEDETGDTVSTALIASGTVSDLSDTVTITNSKKIPIDVGVIVRNGAFILLCLGALAVGAWLVISKRKQREFLDAE